MAKKHPARVRREIRETIIGALIVGGVIFFCVWFAGESKQCLSESADGSGQVWLPIHLGPGGCIRVKYSNGQTREPPNDCRTAYLFRDMILRRDHNGWNGSYEVRECWAIDVYGRHRW